MMKFGMRRGDDIKIYLLSYGNLEVKFCLFFVLNFSIICEDFNLEFRVIF